MSRRYKVAHAPDGWPDTLPFMLQTETGSYKVGDEFEQDLTAEHELANVESGLLEIVPLTYKVVGGSEVHGTPPGETFTLGLPLGQEALLFEGGHIERVEAKAAKADTAAAAKKKTARKEEAS